MRVRVVQRMERDGKWRQVGDVMSPLKVLSDDNNDGENKEQKYAIETSTLELSLDSIA